MQASDTDQHVLQHELLNNGITDTRSGMVKHKICLERARLMLF